MKSNLHPLTDPAKPHYCVECYSRTGDLVPLSIGHACTAICNDALESGATCERQRNHVVESTSRGSVVQTRLPCPGAASHRQRNVRSVG